MWGGPGSKLARYSEFRK